MSLGVYTQNKLLKELRIGHKKLKKMVEQGLPRRSLDDKAYYYLEDEVKEFLKNKGEEK